MLENTLTGSCVLVVLVHDKIPALTWYVRYSHASAQLIWRNLGYTYISRSRLHWQEVLKSAMITSRSTFFVTPKDKSLWETDTIVKQLYMETMTYWRFINSVSSISAMTTNGISFDLMNGQIRIDSGERLLFKYA